MVDIGRPATGLRLATRSLTLLDRGRRGQPQVQRQTNPSGRSAASNGAVDATAALRCRVLVTMADAQVELGQIDEATASLDAALLTNPAGLPLIQASRGVLLYRTGRPAQALEQLDAGVNGLSAVGKPNSNLMRALFWRGMLHLGEARLELAQRDCEIAGQLGREAGLDAAVVIATHNLGLVRWISGDLPGALREMTVAEEYGPQVRSGLRALERARVLLQAGLLAEARENADLSERIFTAERSRVDLADALLVQAEIDLLARHADAARAAARRAARSYGAAGQRRGLLAARVMEARAGAIVRAETRPPMPVRQRRRRAAQDAVNAASLSAELSDAGLTEDAREVRLLEAEAMLELGDIDAAAAAMTAASGVGGSGSGSREKRAERVPSIATELHIRVVGARLELARGQRSAGLLQIRRGLDDLAAYQAKFGSQDLQSASAVHGRDLTRLGLRTALQTGSPAAILQWLERSRAASTRLAAVRPPADGVLARELSKLRLASIRARTAMLAGTPDQALEQEIIQLRRRVRSRSWVAGGTGAVNRPLPLAAVQRRLAANGRDVSVVAPFRGNGSFHALVITATSARYLKMGVDTGLEQVLHRIIGDLNVLADHRIPATLRRVAGQSLQTGLSTVGQIVVQPLISQVADGPIVVAAAGSAAIVPWALLPGLAGRAISVSASVTAAVAGMAEARQDHRSGVLVVAGPEVPHGEREVATVAAAYPHPTVLSGPAATGRAVLDAIPAGGLVHIAAHGHHEQDNPLFSGVLLADGLLYGYDVAPNPAIPAQVVLSSCDVGRTDDRPGGEPLGLVAALLRSGVSTVIAGTSRVSDEVAAAVMPAYHQRLQAGESPAIALAGAIAGVAETDADPAPFTCFGAGL